MVNRLHRVFSPKGPLRPGVVGASGLERRTALQLKSCRANLCIKALVGVLSNLRRNLPLPRLSPQFSQAVCCVSRRNLVRNAA